MGRRKVHEGEAVEDRARVAAMRYYQLLSTAAADKNTGKGYWCGESTCADTEGFLEKCGVAVMAEGCYADGLFKLGAMGSS
jgi:hypothetical protein